MKNNKTAIIVAITAIVALIGTVVYFATKLNNERAEKEQMSELMEIDKREMETEYSDFAKQYNEMQTKITNDSIIRELEIQKHHTQELLEELRRTKSNDAATITRLKKELATVRKVMRSYIEQIDSLSRLNTALSNENKLVKEQYNQATAQISSLSSEKESLSNQVAIAAQLDATAISIAAKNKRGKEAKKAKEATKLAINFTIVKNITAKAGVRTLFVRILKPTNEVLGSKGSIPYENKSIEFTEKKNIEYTGEEQRVTIYSDIQEFLQGGTYKVFIFAEGNMIGSSSFTLK
ncbi:MAG: hypothetical protein IKR18_09905 [Bacteroidaceae bacterium]|nr:hypothetical protein [Bacteroidaceae bacterium]